MYYYRVDCWIPPRSGFDVMKRNQAFNFMESIAEKLSKDKSEEIKGYLNKFKEQSEGLVPKSFTLESDKPVFDPEKEFMTEIQKEHPGAKLAHWELIDAPVLKRPLK